LLIVLKVELKFHSGTSEAFAYDHIAMNMAHEIYDKGWYKDYNVFSKFVFLVTPGLGLGQQRAYHEEL